MVAALAAAGMVAVELFQVRATAPLMEEKLAAANLAADCFDVIRQQRVARGYALDPELDPTGSGMVGLTHQPSDQHRWASGIQAGVGQSEFCRRSCTDAARCRRRAR